jgi:hypothetical protein
VALAASTALSEGHPRTRRHTEAGARRERRSTALRPCGAVEDGEETDSDEADEDRERPAPTASPSRALARLLEQRLDKRLELLTVEGLTRAARRARR